MSANPAFRAEEWPSHPGRALRERLDAAGVTAYQVAKGTGMSIQRVLGILQERWAMTPDSALRLGRYFDVDPEHWMALQARWDLRAARAALGDRLITEVHPPASGVGDAHQVYGL